MRTFWQVVSAMVITPGVRMGALLQEPVDVQQDSRKIATQSGTEVILTSDETATAVARSLVLLEGTIVLFVGVVSTIGLMQVS